MNRIQAIAAGHRRTAAERKQREVPRRRVSLQNATPVKKQRGVRAARNVYRRAG